MFNAAWLLMFGGRRYLFADFQRTSALPSRSCAGFVLQPQMSASAALEQGSEAHLTKLATCFGKLMAWVSFTFSTPSFEILDGGFAKGLQQHRWRHGFHLVSNSGKVYGRAIGVNNLCEQLRLHFQSSCR